MRRHHRPSSRRRAPLLRRLAMVDWLVWLGVGVVLALLARTALANPASRVSLPGEPWHWAVSIAALFSALALHSFLDARRRRAWARTMHGVENLLRLDWRQFEKWVAECYRARGYSVQLCGGGGADGGVDLVCRRKADGATCIVQCKHWRGRVGAKEVREMFGLMHHHQATAAHVVALRGFTKEARQFAVGKPLRLVDGEAAISALKRPRRA